MLLVASVATSASAAKKPDLRLLLSKTPHRIFLGRIAGVAFHPGPVTTVSASGDADLVNAVLYWLRVGNEYEARLAIRLASADDLVRLKFENELDERFAALHTHLEKHERSEECGPWKREPAP